MSSAFGYVTSAGFNIPCSFCHLNLLEVRQSVSCVIITKLYVKEQEKVDNRVLQYFQIVERNSELTEALKAIKNVAVHPGLETLLIIGHKHHYL